MSGHGPSEHPADPEDNVNYDYLREYVLGSGAAEQGARVLDYGCGAGALVRMLRAAGVDARGADIFYAGADYTDDPELGGLLEQGILREIAPDGGIPFDDDSFDLVISNQVLEHVEDLPRVAAELDRVLAPGGTIYHQFPSREVWREGHIGIPFAHRMRPGRLRTGYTLALRRLGFGYHDDQGLTPRQWTDEKLGWVDRYCYYRPYDEIAGVLGDGYEINHREIDYCRFRAAGRPVLDPVMRTAILRRPIERIFRRVAFMALELRRSRDAAEVE